MAKIYDCGMIKSHHRYLGINHKYIVKKLSRNNWNKRAIVRDGKYIYIVKCKFSSGPKIRNKTVYKVSGTANHFNTLCEAIFFANNFSEREGEYPKEKHNSIKFFTIKKFPKINENK